MKKLLNKKNNKGFSLVELIVVVLIMGIIAVALAPQVMKWVDTARTNSNENTRKDIKSAVQIAAAEAQRDSQSTAGVFYSKNDNLYDNTGTTIATGGMANYIRDVMTEFPEPQNGGSYKIEIDSKGAVKVEISTM